MPFLPFNKQITLKKVMMVKEFKKKSVFFIAVLTQGILITL